MTQLSHLDRLESESIHIIREVAAEYADIESDHQIIDIGAARIAAEPEIFDVVVTPNLYGDILSDIASHVAGSVGLSGSANIGQDVAMFEAVHGSAPDIAGQGICNPTAALFALSSLLRHVGETTSGEGLRASILEAIAAGEKTRDIGGSLDTATFTDAVAERFQARLGASAAF